MTELVLFIVVGALAVAAAVMMLLSQNAVHSALFLIVTMGCLAFLFLMLNAPFLAMIQITVYAGAIMVLFLFVIMLLGSEKLQYGEPGSGQTKYRWFTPLALLLALTLLIAAGITIIQGQVDLLETPSQPPQVRVLNAAPNAGAIAIAASTGETFASGLAFGQVSDFVLAPEGQVTLVGPADAPALGTVVFEPNKYYTLVAYGNDNLPRVTAVEQDFTPLENERNARLQVFNAYEGIEAISLVDLGLEFDQDDTRVIVPPLAFGQLSGTLVQREGEVPWVFIEGTREDRPLYRMHEFEVERSTTELLVLAPEPRIGGVVRTALLAVKTETAPSFGGPRAIGEKLFTTFMLPFQLLGVLLLAAMVGAIVLTHPETDKRRRKLLGRRRVARPLTNVIAAQVGRDVVEAGSEQSEPEGAR